MDTLTEKVARAIAEVENGAPFSDEFWKDWWGYKVGTRLLERKATAAIEALRKHDAEIEVTDAMVEAACLEWIGAPNDGSHSHFVYSNEKSSMRRAIAASLKARVLG